MTWTRRMTFKLARRRDLFTVKAIAAPRLVLLVLLQTYAYDAVLPFGDERGDHQQSTLRASRALLTIAYEEGRHLRLLAFVTSCMRTWCPGSSPSSLTISSPHLSLSTLPLSHLLAPSPLPLPLPSVSIPSSFPLSAAPSLSSPSHVRATVAFIPFFADIFLALPAVPLPPSHCHHNRFLHYLSLIPAISPPQPRRLAYAVSLSQPLYLCPFLPADSHNSRRHLAAPLPLRLAILAPLPPSLSSPLQ
ncbi:hypothetical protein EDB83DRAFT_2676947 [Lactarius deliciosus]|nr:hypothetical protein EDB83DRAFT_2676947 [Lactarius deliciosus]